MPRARRSGWTSFVADPGEERPRTLHEEDNPVDPLSDEAGGDRFDLATLDSEDPIAVEIQEDGAACVRLRSASVDGFPSDPASNGADIDGVYAAEVR